MTTEEKPDTARSWAICFAACVINTMLSGISRTTGLFYVALIETYGVTRLQANLPFTVRNIVRNLSGPIVGAIGQRYGARDVTIAGGLFATFGILLCTFVSDITWITILWGGMHGFGVALGNTLFQIIVTQYFVKYRATACGIAISGACVGSFVFPIIIEYTLFKAGLSGTFLITGGLMMHVLPAAIMMIEPPWIQRQIQASLKAQQQEKPKHASSKSHMFTGKNMGIIKEESDGIVSSEKDIAVVSMRKISSRTTSAAISYDEDGFNRQLQLNKGYDNPAYTGSRTDLSQKEFNQKSFYENRTNSSSSDVRNKSKELNSRTIEEVTSYEVPYPRLRTLSIGELSITVPVEPTAAIQEVSLYKSMMKICRDPMFHLISVSLAAFAMVFDPAITVIVDYLMDKGMEEDLAKYFISMLALGDLIGRMCFGWVTDKNYLSISKFVMLLQLIQGVCFLLTPLFYSFDVLMTIMVIYGLASGANLVMIPLLVSKYLQSVQSLAIGSIQFFSGILSFAVPPVIGYFRDQVGSYDGMFYITGGMSVIAGFLWLLEPPLLKLREKIEKKELTNGGPS